MRYHSDTISSYYERVIRNAMLHLLYQLYDMRLKSSQSPILRLLDKIVHVVYINHSPYLIKFRFRNSKSWNFASLSIIKKLSVRISRSEHQRLVRLIATNSTIQCLIDFLVETVCISRTFALNTDHWISECELTSEDFDWVTSLFSSLFWP